ncbi:hypothetical protein DYB28_006320 [Aphanomyces astaci]|uniref:HTH psq-type domain-containing protein n=1 Tax=Aphanomyces astaci TaxID=112090 RepID=A0A9X8EGS2_APHAT|nr:hypothetical protein DYB28_006320 [Aphanomyces astaci]
MQSTLRIPKRNYNIAIKQEVLRLLAFTVDYKVAELMNIPRRTIRTCVEQKVDILAYLGNKKRKKIKPGVMAAFKRYLHDERLTEEMVDGEDGDDIDTPTAALKYLVMIKRATLLGTVWPPMRSAGSR